MREQNGGAELGRFDRTIRLATAGTLAYACWLPVSGLGGLSTFDTGFALVASAVAVVVIGLLHVWHVWFAARDVRPPLWPWTLAAMGLVAIALFLVAYNVLGRPMQMLIASALILLPVRWSMAVVTAIVAGVIAFAVGDGFVGGLPFILGGVFSYGVGSAVLVHLVVALRRLQASRTELAQSAVVRERLRIDTELSGTVGLALARIAEQGDRTMATDRPAQLCTELSGIADAARQTLAAVRHAVRGYQQVSLRAELDTAVTLLAAAGVEATVIGAPETVDVDDETRAALRTDVAALLRDGGSTTHCTIEVLAGPQLRIRGLGR